MKVKIVSTPKTAGALINAEYNLKTLASISQDLDYVWRMFGDEDAEKRNADKLYDFEWLQKRIAEDYLPMIKNIDYPGEYPQFIFKIDTETEAGIYSTLTKAQGIEKVLSFVLTYLLTPSSERFIRKGFIEFVEQMEIADDFEELIADNAHAVSIKDVVRAYFIILNLAIGNEQLDDLFDY